MTTIILSYIHWDVNPTIFEIPFVNWPVRWYGLLWALGLIASQQVMYYIFKKENRPSKDVDSLTLYIILGALIGARLGHFLFYEPEAFLQKPLEIILPPYAGLASHGGAIGILIGLWLFCRKHKYNYLWMVDRLVIVVCITGAAIRFGNLMNSEIPGKPSDVPWAFVFEKIDSLPRHPAQLYESIYCVLLFALLFYIWKNKRNLVSNGFIFGIFLVVLWSLRFVDEFFKENQVSFEDKLPLNMGQFLSIPFVIIGLILLIRAWKKPERAVISTTEEDSSNH